MKDRLGMITCNSFHFFELFTSDLLLFSLNSQMRVECMGRYIQQYIGMGKEKFFHEIVHGKVRQVLCYSSGNFIEFSLIKYIIL